MPMLQVTMHIPSELLDAVDKRAGYGNRSAWIREAIKRRLAIEGGDDGHHQEADVAAKGRAQQ